VTDEISGFGVGRYAGGDSCPACDATVSVVDRYCRRCGEALFDEERDKRND